MILLHSLPDIEEVALGGATSGILYKGLPKEIIIERGLNTYTTCRFNKYGHPNNTSQVLRVEASHNTSSVKGLML